MSVNFVKIVELLSIESLNNESYLHIKISLDQELQLFYKIDAFTANSLRSICDFDESHKYRLSLRTKTDSSSDSYISYVTKTYLSNSNRLTFSCSEEFITQLELIKQCTNRNNLLQLTFLSTSLPTDTEEHVKNQEIESATIISNDEHSKASLIVNNKELSDNINETNKKIDQKEAQENEKNTPIQNEALQGDKEIERLQKPSPQKVKYKAGKWVSIASLGLLVVILASFFIFKPDQKVIQHQEKEEVKTILQDSNIKSPSSEKPNSLTVDEFITFNLPEGYVAFTFNEGPSAYTEQIVDILDQYKIGATFFFIGSQVTKYPNSVHSVNSRGYAIGSMTLNNIELATLPYEQQEEELLASMESIEKVTEEKVHLFRPSAAIFNQDTQDILKKNDVKLTLWNNDPKEVKNDDTTELLDIINNSELSGSIVYLEETQEVVEALSAIIENAQKQNLKIVSIN